MKKFAERLKSARKNARIGQTELAEKVKISVVTLSRYENGKRNPNVEDLRALADALDTTNAYLLGETDDPSPAAKELWRQGVAQLRQVMGGRREESANGATPPYSRPDYDLVKLPVLSMGNVVCAGNGFSLDYVDEEIAGYEYFSRSDLGPIDETNGPFVMRVEGDSMEEAGIPDGAKVAINPAAEVYDGDSALVCYGLNRERAVKWIYWGTDGSVKIRSSNSRYEPRIFTKEDRDLGFFFVVGKVMQVSTKPLRG